MSATKDVFAFYDNSPHTLFDQCMSYIVQNLNTITTLDPHSRWRKLKDDVILPKEICERFLEAYQKVNRVTDNIANLFRDRSRTLLETVKLRNSCITDESLRFFLEHKPIEVELVQCEYISQASLDVINANSDNLQSLKFGPATFVLTQDDSIYRVRGYVIDAPKLKSLTIHRRGHPIFPMLLLRHLTQLTHLDLSECISAGSVFALHDMKNLKSLVLHSVYWTKDITDWIHGLKFLRHLDISQANERHGKYFNPNIVLRKIVTSLPHLESLDISGTNLAGSGVAAVSKLSDESSGDSMDVEVCCDIPGLVTRVNQPLEFLGLYATHHGACKRHDIPAKVVSVID